MKILFYSPVNLRNGGGCERWHCDVTASLALQFGHQIEIATGDLGDRKWSADYLQSQLGGTPYSIIKSWDFGGVALLYQKFKQADVVHFIHGFAGQDLLILALKMLTQKKVIVGHHAPILHKIAFHNWYMKYVSRKLLNLFNGQMTLNSKDKIFLKQEWGIRNVNFIPSGVRVEKFLAVKRLRHKMLNFITVGIYRMQKGIDLYLSAITDFNARNPNNKAVFHLVGGGEMQELVNSYTKKQANIIDHGYVEYQHIPKLYADSDIYVLPSREEPFGLVLIEAWAAGLPVLATKTEGPLDMLIPGKNGWFIEEISSAEICQSIENIYKQWLSKPESVYLDESLCRRTGKKYSIDTTASAMHNAFFKA